MYLRKQHEGIKSSYKLSDDEEIDREHMKYKDNLAYDIYGPGHGLESTHPLKFWVDKKQEEGDDWEEIDVKGEGDNKKNKNGKKNLFNNQDDDGEDSDEEDLDEDYFGNFFEENTKELKSGKFSCKFCENKKLSYEAMKKHFIKTHQKEYESTPYSKSASWKEAIEINKKIEEQFEEQFMEEMMGGGDEDMGFDFGFGNPFGKEGNSKENKKMMKDLEKMMMGMFMGPGMGMPGGNNTKRKKNKIK
jgi:hypothetical protein